MTRTFRLKDSQALRDSRLRFIFKRETSAARVFYSLEADERFAASARQVKREQLAEAMASATTRLYARQETLTLEAPIPFDGIHFPTCEILCSCCSDESCPDYPNGNDVWDPSRVEGGFFVVDDSVNS